MIGYLTFVAKRHWQYNNITTVLYIIIDVQYSIVKIYISLLIVQNIVVYYGFKVPLQARQNKSGYFEPDYCWTFHFVMVILQSAFLNAEGVNNTEKVCPIHSDVRIHNDAIVHRCNGLISVLVWFTLIIFGYYRSTLLNYSAYCCCLFHLSLQTLTSVKLEITTVEWRVNVSMTSVHFNVSLNNVLLDNCWTVAQELVNIFSAHEEWGLTLQQELALVCCIFSTSYKLAYLAPKESFIFWITKYICWEYTFVYFGWQNIYIICNRQISVLDLMNIIIVGYYSNQIKVKWIYCWTVKGENEIEQKWTTCFANITRIL